ncbi:uncharacterized protein LOC110679523 [Aedes aegypti]|uniref:Uncharacterized protein n=1 Tax=Aedes aegypti TaxID=7159 RepID=A0A6I8U2C5_AEDAE|nr:uncharacterized protein LOC110679523 [Aedes aegypti]
MGRKCEFYLCGNHQGSSERTKHVSFYGFPKSEVLCALWVESCLSEEILEVFKTLGASAFSKRKICSDHFPSEAFRDVHNKNKGLKPGAVPTSRAKIDFNAGFESFLANSQDAANENLESNEMTVEFIDGDDDFAKWFQLTSTETFPENEHQNYSTTNDDTPNSNAGECSMAADYSLSPAQSDIETECLLQQPAFDNPENILQTSSEVSEQRKHFEGIEEFEVIILSQDSIESHSQVDKTIEFRQRIKEKEATIKALRRKIHFLRRQMFVQDQTSKRRLMANNKHKKLIFSLRKELRLLKKTKTENELLGEQAKQNPIIYDTLKNATRSTKGRRYHSDTKKFASGTYLSGPRTYRFVRKSTHLVLPHKSTVYGYNRNIRINPGLNKTILSRMKNRVKDFKSKRDRIVMVCLDGMSIKPELTYCAKSDTFHGFPFDGTNRRIEKNDPAKLATEAVVVMTSGIYSRFKQVIVPIPYLMP